MKNIVCIMPYMGNSGAEKVMFNVMNNLDRNKFKPYILLYKCDNDKNSLIPFLKNDIEVSYLNINGRVRSCLFKYVFSIRKFCKFKRLISYSLVMVHQTLHLVLSFGCLGVKYVR